MDRALTYRRRGHRAWLDDARRDSRWVVVYGVRWAVGGDVMLEEDEMRECATGGLLGCSG